MAQAAGSARSTASGSPGDRVGGGQSQHGAQALAAGHEAVAHRLVQRRRTRGRSREPPVERASTRSRDLEEGRGGGVGPAHPRFSPPSARLSRAGRSGFELAAIVEHLNAALGVLESGVAEPGQLHAALVQRERLLEREVALLQGLDDALELADRRFEVVRAVVGAHASCSEGSVRDMPRSVRAAVAITSQCSSPRASVTRTAWPTSSGSASRSSVRPSSDQQSAYPRPRTASGLRLASRAESVRHRVSPRPWRTRMAA
jgi:hypothetical protein